MEKNEYGSFSLGLQSKGREGEGGLRLSRIKLERAGTVLEIDSNELCEFLSLKEVKPGTKMVIGCQMLRRGTGLLGLINV